jgi:hypothetical protein
MALWFAWLSGTQQWEDRGLGIVAGFTVSAAWCVASFGLGVASVYSLFHRPGSR